MDDLTKLDLAELQRQVAHNEEALPWYANIGARGYDATRIINERLARLRNEIARREYWDSKNMP